MAPLFQSRGEVDIYMDLCEKAGLLFGKDGFLDRLNGALGLKDPYKLDLNVKPAVRDVFDRWARSQGLAEGISYFETKGVWQKGPVPAAKYYGFAQNPPFNGIYHRFYGESLLRYQREMQSRGVDRLYWQDYTPLPTWRDPTMWQSPAQYDLTLISLKKIEFKQSRASQIALLAEMAPEQRLAMNPAAAEPRNIQDGDEVTVESQNAVTGETRSIMVKVMLTEAVRPDTVALPHHYGEVANHPLVKGQGPTPNALYFTGEGYITNTNDNSFHVKVRVFKA
jgi:anaerobic selenocysteine-containing dehydrogenase